MDFLSIAGILLAFGAILGGQALEGGSVGSIMQLTAFLIVFGGTIGAVLLQYDGQTALRAVKMLKWVFLPPAVDGKALIVQVVEWANQVRKGGLLQLEPLIDSQTDPFLQRGLQTLADGKDPEQIQGILEIEIALQEKRELLAAKFYEAAGGYAPTVGILGAVLGLIHVMENLDDPSKLGEGIAVAFVATVYGVGAANLIFLPIANKLKYLAQQRAQIKEMWLEGFMAIATGENPRSIESKLSSYLQD